MGDSWGDAGDAAWYDGASVDVGYFDPANDPANAVASDPANTPVWSDNGDGTYTNSSNGDIWEDGVGVVGNVKDGTPDAPIMMDPFIVSADPAQTGGVNATSGFLGGLLSSVGAFFNSNAISGGGVLPSLGGTKPSSSSGSGASGSFSPGQSTSIPKPPTALPTLGGVSNNTLLIALAAGAVAYSLGSRRSN